MADVELGDLRDCGDGNDVVEGQAVAGVRLDAVLHRQCRAVGNPLELDRSFFAFRVSVAPRVELDDGGAEPQGGVDLPLGRLDEQAYADVGGAELVDVISEVIVLAGRIE